MQSILGSFPTRPRLAQMSEAPEDEIPSFLRFLRFFPIFRFPRFPHFKVA